MKSRDRALEPCRCNTEKKLLGVQSIGYFTSHSVRSLAFPSLGLCCLLRKRFEVICAWIKF